MRGIEAVAMQIECEIGMKRGARKLLVPRGIETMTVKRTRPFLPGPASGIIPHG